MIAQGNPFAYEFDRPSMLKATSGVTFTTVPSKLRLEVGCTPIPEGASVFLGLQSKRGGRKHGVRFMSDRAELVTKYPGKKERVGPAVNLCDKPGGYMAVIDSAPDLSGTHATFYYSSEPEAKLTLYYFSVLTEPKESDGVD